MLQFMDSKGKKMLQNLLKLVLEVMKIPRDWELLSKFLFF